MSSENNRSDSSGACEVHGGHARKANFTLIAMILVGFGLIVWHVWMFGASTHSHHETAAVSGPFLPTLGVELWNLLTDRHGILAELRDIFPYFIVGILVAGYIRTYKIAVKLQLTLKKYGVMSVFVASFIGIITPLCACGTLTTAISLLFAGIPLAPVMSLMVTSSLMSPSTYLLTLNDMGAEWTVVRTLAALLMGVFAGLVTHFLKRWGIETKKVFIDGAIVRGDFHDEDYPDERLRCGCKQKFGNRVALKTSNKFLIFLAKSSEMLWMVGKYVLVGVMIGAIVERYMPSDWIYYFFGRKDPLNVFWITLASVPMFLHQISASSILFHIKGSLHGTLDSGSALAFMIGGPVTAMPTLVMFWTIFRKRVFFLYLAICIVGTLLITYSIQAVFFVQGMDTGNPLLKGVSSLTGGAAAIIRKQSEHVRIVMDPSEKPLVAYYSNLLGKEGGVVFDAGISRFSRTEIADNRRYIANLSSWLEQSSASEAKGSILVYDLSGEFSAGHASMRLLEDENFKVNIISRKNASLIRGAQLKNQSQVWLFFGKDKALTDEEISALIEFNHSGGAVLIALADAGNVAGANVLAQKFGAVFNGQTVHDEKIPVAVAAPMFYRTAEWIGKLLKLTYKA